MQWTNVDVDILEALIIRAKAEALSEKSDLARLGTAYHDRQGIQTRIEDMDQRIAYANHLLALTKGLRPNTIGATSAS